MDKKKKKRAKPGSYEAHRENGDLEDY